MTVLVRIVRMRTIVAFFSVIMVQNLSGAPQSLAQPFEVIGLGEVESKGDVDANDKFLTPNEERRGFEAGEIEFEANSAYQSGFPGDAEEATRFASELSVGLAVTDYLKIEGGVVLTRERGGDLTASNVAIEATVSPKRFQKKKFGAGLFLALEPRVDDDATNEFVFGLIFEQKVTDAFQITVNTFLEDTFGPNSEEGLAFAYGWQVKRELPEGFAKGFAIGLEGYGEIEDVFGNPPDLDEQEHRVGPVIYLDGEVVFERKFEASFGILAGITDETPDVAFKLNIEIPLGGEK